MLAGGKLYAALGGGALALLGAYGFGAYWLGRADARAACAERAAEDIAEAAEKAVEEIAAQAVSAAAASERLTSAAEMADAARLRLKGELDALPAGDACFDPGAYERMQDVFRRLFPAETLPSGGGDNGPGRDA